MSAARNSAAPRIGMSFPAWQGKRPVMAPLYQHSADAINGGSPGPSSASLAILHVAKAKQKPAPTHVGTG